MPGDRLMCLWQAVFAKDVFPESGVKRATVKSVTEALATSALMHYQEAKFDEIFTMQKIEFGVYVDYVMNTLRAVGSPRLLVCETIEDICWEIVEEAELYSNNHLTLADLKKLWLIFNRISKTGSYPPTAAKSEVNWFFEQVAKSLGNTWVSHESIPTKGLTFQEFSNVLDRTFFAASAPTLLRQCIEDLFCLVVREVLKVGWLSKRTKKQANWTNWLKRWFVLTPKGLVYYESEKCKSKKGEVLIDSNSVVEGLPDYSSFTKKLTSRFKLTNKKSLEIEMCGESELDKQQWLNNLKICIECAKTGITPMSKFLHERAKKLSISHEDSVEKLDKEIEEKQALARRVSKKITEIKPDAKPNKHAPKLGALTEENSQDDSTASRGNTPPPVADELEEYDNNAIEAQKEKIKLVFFRIDKNGNGKIEKDEFFDFIQGLGLNMPRSETNVIFESVDQDDNGFLCFGEFYDYFVNSIIGEKSGQNKSDAKLRAAFLAADRDGSGTVSFREFAEFAWSKRRDVALNDLLAAFERLDVDKSGEINYKEFREFFGNQRTSFGEGMIQTPGSAEPTPAFEEMMKGFYNAADAQQLANYLRNRWTKFASFKRAGASGDLVMKGSHDMVADCIPGEYSLIDLACFSDLAPIKPKTTIVKGVTWHKSSVPGKSGRLIFPMDFEAKIPTSFATNETLAYYGCSMADGNQLKVSLLYRHGIQDFTYENNYLDEYVLNEKALGGAGLEKHGFAHLDCPLDEDSGFFMLGKFEGDELHLTAFKIPTRHTLYVPPMTIHCNDYLKGTWRTMLSDEAEIDHVQLVKMHRQGNMESYEHFRFNFLPLL